MSTAVFNFKQRFVPRIKARIKQQTIRSKRKRTPVAGDHGRLQHGSRFKPQLIGWATLESVAPILVDIGGSVILPGRIIVRAQELDAFAVLDGFDDWDDMRAFWIVTHPALPIFNGHIYRWGNSFRLPAAGPAGPSDGTPSSRL